MWCRSLVEISTKLRPPKCRSLVEVWSKFGRSLVSQFGRHFIKFTMYSIYIPSKLRPNFDTGGVEVWSKFRHWGCRSFVDILTKLRPPSVEVWSN